MVHPLSHGEHTLNLRVEPGVDLASLGQQARSFVSGASAQMVVGRELIALCEDQARRLLHIAQGGGQLALAIQGPDAMVEWAVPLLRAAPPTPTGTPGSAAMADDRRLVTAMSSVSLPSKGPPTRGDGETRLSGAGIHWLPRTTIRQAVVLARPHPQENVNGDVPLIMRQGTKLRLAVVDGLGHGQGAHAAARCAVDSLRRDMALDVADAVRNAHDQMAGTRGASLGIADIDLQTRMVRGTTVGNVRVALFFAPRSTWSPCGTDAVLGYGRGGVGRLDVRVEQHPLPPDGVVCLFSDGLQSQLRPPLARAELDDLAIQLFHTFVVPRDDATLIVAG